MRWETVGDPSFTALRIFLDSGDAIYAEPGAYLMDRGELKVETSSFGIFRGLKRRMFGGEAFFLNKFTAIKSTELLLVPPYPGDIKYFPLTHGLPLYISDFAFLAYHGDIKLDTAWIGGKAIFVRGGPIWLKAEGTGGVWISSYGQIIEKELGMGENLRVDNDHLLAMTKVKWNIRKLGGLKTFFLGGEGFIVEVQGPGKIFFQTRSMHLLADAILRYMPKK